ncbi:MAG TPA: nucleoside triphosphate pyrophosphatase [Syntrophales bacterium]|nr:nucleoside triphosphate pyrophosphatase [Syntrophales bacterium]
MKTPELILASASPRRREMLRMLGVEFTVLQSSVDENPHAGESPEAYALRLSEAKARAVAALRPGRWVLGADTIVTIDGELLGKPRTPEEARRMIRRLSGRAHTVITAFTLFNSGRNRPIRRAVSSQVVFKEIPDDELEWYVSTDEPYDKAGGYAVQGKAALFVSEVHGSWTSVVGLPLCEVVEALKGLGLADFTGRGPCPT